MGAIKIVTESLCTIFQVLKFWSTCVDLLVNTEMPFESHKRRKSTILATFLVNERFLNRKWVMGAIKIVTESSGIIFQVLKFWST